MTIFGSILRKLLGRSTRPGTFQVCLYTRAGCHLCQQAKDQLLQTLGDSDYSFSEIDVDSDPGLAALYGNDVPVVLINGKLRFRGSVNPVLLGRLLRAKR